MKNPDLMQQNETHFIMEKKMKEFDLKPLKIKQQYAVYMMYMRPCNTLYHIGLCKFVEVFNTPDARRNKHFDANRDYKLFFDGPYDKLVAQRRLAEVRSREKRTPVLQRQTYETMQPVILCNETGQLFRIQADAAKHYDIPQAVISNIINQRPGFRSAQGLTFRRIPCPDVKTLIRLRQGETVYLSETAQPSAPVISPSEAMARAAGLQPPVAVAPPPSPTVAPIPLIPNNK